MEALSLLATNYYRRTQGQLSDMFHTKTILVVGCGAGSYFIEKLARLGPAALILVDPDGVEVSNLVRSAFRMVDVGHAKVDALASRIQEINPMVAVRALQQDICTLPSDELADLIQGVDLIVAGTDHFPAQALLNRLSQTAGIPVLFIGIHADAAGGRIVWSVPGLTPCYRCVAAERYTAFADGGIGQTDLMAAHGLLMDIQFIDMTALKVAVALLERGQDSTMGRFCTQMGNRNEIVVRTSPDYAYGALLWDAVLADLPTTPKAYAQELREQVLFTFDTLWLQTERVADCPDCNKPGGKLW